MKSLTKAIFEHLKTKKKYNVLLLKLEMVKEDLERKQVELNTERLIHKKKSEVWEKKLKDQELKILKLKDDLAKLKKRKKKEVK